MEKEQEDEHNKANKKKEKISKLSSALKKNLLRRKSVTIGTKKEKIDG